MDMRKKAGKTGAGRKKAAAVKRGRVMVRDEVGLGTDGSDETRGRGGVGERGGFEGETVVPCPVPTDPAMGDKTPAVMAWYRQWRPEEFERRYGNRICPEVDEGVVRVMGACGDERGPVSDFEDEEDEVVLVKPRVIMG